MDLKRGGSFMTGLSGHYFQWSKDLESLDLQLQYLQGFPVTGRLVNGRRHGELLLAPAEAELSSTRRTDRSPLSNQGNP